MAGDISFSPADGFFDTSTPAVQGAQEVVTDVPNSFFWARYQAGDIGGWRYAIFPDGSGTVSRGVRDDAETLRLVCTQGVACRVTRNDGSSFEVLASGAPAPSLPSTIDGDALARYLANWVLAGTGSPARQDPITPQNIEQPVRAPEPTDTAQPPLVIEPLVEDNALADTPEPVIAPPPPPPENIGVLDLTVPEEAAPRAPRVIPVAPATPRGAPLAAPLNAQTTAQTPQQPDFFERANLRCSITTSTSLSYNNRSSGSDGPGKLRANLGCSTTITENLSARFALVGYADPSQQEDYDPDFTYAFTYRITDTISLGYSNYGGRFDTGFLDAFGSGNLRASFALPRLTLPNDRAISCTASLGLPNPADTSANLSCGYSITDKFRIGATASLYLPGEQGEFNPDYTYTASYRISDDWQLSYNNYSNNRFPWNRGESPGPGFSGGSLSLTYSFAF